MDALKLMQDYFWILETCQDPDVIFNGSPAEKEFASLWLSKLCNDIYRDLSSKRLRNVYLLELSNCIANAQLSEMFMQLPPKGPLAPFKGASKLNIDRKLIVYEMQAAAAESIPLVSPRNYQSHLSTKIFDDNRGACAYLAVSLGDPQQGPVWMKMGCKKPFAENKENNSRKCSLQSRSIDYSSVPEAMTASSDDDDVSNVNVGFGEFCLNAISQELAGHAQPCDCPELETQLKKYASFIKNYKVGEAAKTLTGNKLRTFLLLNLQTDLVQSLEGYQ